MSHITGPSSVLVSLKFGEPPESGPFVLIRCAADYVKAPQFDLTEYVDEVLYGVREGNRRYGGDLEVEEIEISNLCFPARGQVGHCAEKLVGFALGHLSEDGTDKTTGQNKSEHSNR
ncbi:MAG: hypothetical protein AAF357_00140 [Verrucomicrobiota bacterium]